MTAKEYLKQAYRLDKIIESLIQEVEDIKILATSIQSPTFTEKVQSTKRQEAPFVKTLEKILELETKINNKIKVRLELKNQITEVIESVKNADGKLVLRHRYILGETWEQIATKLCADERTIRRWHSKALQQVILPDDIIKL